MKQPIITADLAALVDGYCAKSMLENFISSYDPRNTQENYQLVCNIQRICERLCESEETLTAVDKLALKRMLQTGKREFILGALEVVAKYELVEAMPEVQALYLENYLQRYFPTLQSRADETIAVLILAENRQTLLMPSMHLADELLHPAIGQADPELLLVAINSDNSSK